MRRIELLVRSHARDVFDCGNESLNSYLRRIARQHAEKGISRTFVMVDTAEPETVLCYATLALCEVRAERLPAKLAKKYPPVVPGAKLARLAVDRRRQQEGLGTRLLVDMMERTMAVAESVGIVALFVDAKDEAAARYYKQFGFLPMADADTNLFLPMATLRQALAVKP
jgi:ribosomal protein S18 acetylase RimI-like enzyme